MVLAAVVVVPVVAVALSLAQPVRYAATARVLLNTQNLASSSLTTTPQVPASPVPPERVADTQAQLARVSAVVQRALESGPAAGMTIQQFLSSSAVSSDPNTDLLAFTVTAAAGARAEALATAYATAFTKYRSDLDTAPVRKARAHVHTLLTELKVQGQTGSPLYRNLQAKDQSLQSLEVAADVERDSRSAGADRNPGTAEDLPQRADRDRAGVAARDRAGLPAPGARRSGGHRHGGEQRAGASPARPPVGGAANSAAAGRVGHSRGAQQPSCPGLPCASRHNRFDDAETGAAGPGNRPADRRQAGPAARDLPLDRDHERDVGRGPVDDGREPRCRVRPCRAARRSGQRRHAKDNRRATDVPRQVVRTRTAGRRGRHHPPPGEPRWCARLP